MTPVHKKASHAIKLVSQRKKYSERESDDANSIKQTIKTSPTEKNKDPTSTPKLQQNQITKTATQTSI